MSKITVYESVGSASQLVTNYRDLENHHPSKRLQESGRVYARVGGENEEIVGNYRGTAALTPGGEYMVSKDMVLTAPGLSNGNVPIPSPAAGVIGKIDRDDGVITINDPKTGETMFSIRHAKVDPNLKAGDKVEYGQSLGKQHGYNNGKPDAFPDHVHFDVNTRYIAQADKWIKDMHAGTLSTDRRPAQAENLTNERPSFVPISGTFPKPADPPLADGKLSYGEHGPEVEKLQRALVRAGALDAEGKALNPDRDFGGRTRESVESYQRTHGMAVTGVADRKMLTDLGVIGPAQQQAPQQPAPQQPAPKPPTPAQPAPQAPPAQAPAAQQPAQANPYGFGADNALGKVISRGEGGYNSYNRGVAGDAKGAQIDFSQMTVGEVMRRQDLAKSDPNRLFAVGKYQFTPNTLEGAVSTLGIDKNAKFTPQLQEKMFADYLIDEKRPSVRAYVTGKTGGPEGKEAAQHALALEFASVGDPRKGGRGYYDNDSAGNKASITPEAVGKAMDDMRAQYQKNLQAGQTPEQAYRALSGDPNRYPQATQGTQTPNKPADAMADGVLKYGERGESVKKLQEALNAAGIRDGKGNALPTTGYFGDQTEAAVRRFQEQKGLVVDGDAGKNTLTALGLTKAQQTPTRAVDPVQPAQATPQPAQPSSQAPAQPAPQQTAPQSPASSTPQPPAAQAPAQSQPTQQDKPLMSNPGHPDHRLYQQAMSNLEQLGPNGGFKSREDLDKAAAAVAADAKASGLTQIDHISRSKNGEGLITIQGQDPWSDSAKRSFMDHTQATTQTVEQSSRMAEGVKPAQPSESAAQQEQVKVAAGVR